MMAVIGRAVAAEWHMDHFDAGLPLHELAAEKRKRREARAAVGHLAGVGLAYSDQLTHIR